MIAENDELGGANCQACGTAYPIEIARSMRSGAQPCAACGETNPVYHLTLTATSRTRVVMQGKARDVAAKVFTEMKSGDDFHRDSGRWRHLLRLIDRRNNRYVERITEHDGTVAREVDGPLTEHRGHGADRSQPKTHP